MNIYSKKINIYIGIFIIIGSFFLLSYFLPKFENKVKNELVKTISYAYKHFIKNINNLIVKEYNITSLENLKNIRIRKELKDTLSLLKNEKIKYIFAVYREDNVYRILVDASSDESLNFDEIFIPTDEEEKALEKIYKTKKSYIIFHQEEGTREIGITILEPIVVNNKVLSVVFVDFSVQTLLTINKFMTLLKTALLFIILFTATIILFLIFTTLKAIQFKKKAYIDELTGVYNRNYLEEILPEINLSKYAVALFDIDFFKKINDTYGHKAGDKILKDFAKILKDTFRKDEDIIVRYGGEEFLALIKKDRNNKLLPLNAVNRVIDRIRNTLFEFESKPLKLTASVGVYLDTEKEKSLTEAIKKADLALYKAKLEGRNRVEIYEENNIYVSITKINNLIEDGNILCYYQPVVCLNEPTKVLYFESLVRLKDKNGKFIYPNEFIEIIKHTYIYAKLTKKVIEFNIEVLKKHKNINISVNLSPSDFVNESIVDFLLSLDDKFIKRLKLEVLETEEIKNYSKVLENLKKLKDKGFQISLDDFGSGYSNFEYLLKLDIDYIKIDANLIKNINVSKKSEKLVKSIVLFAEGSKIGTIAEFIENREILETVKELGVEYGQGYYFSKPKPIEDFLEDKNWNI